MSSGRMTAVEIARRYGRSKRCVLQWARQGCPHIEGEREGRECQLYDPQEVRAWLASRGLSLREASPAAEKNARTGSAPPRQEARRSPALAEDAEWESVAGRLTSTLDDLLSQSSSMIGEDSDPGGMQKLASSIKHILGELRSIQELRFKAAERSKQYVERSKVREILAAQGSMFAQDLGGLAADLPRHAVGVLIDSGCNLSREDLTRLISHSAECVVEALRDRRATIIDRAIAAVEGEAS